MDIKEIISKMTLEEKAGLCSGLNYWETKPVERLGVPSVLMTDGPHGLRKIVSGPESGKRESIPATCFPPAVLSACSFDRELLHELGEAIAEEALFEDIHIVLGPGVNIKRSPLCGRNFEYFSEDPYLAGEMASAFIKGVEGKGVGTSLKHFAANNQETRRWSSDSRIDERTLREIYLPAFKKAVETAKPATVMCSYNRINGEYGSENHRLLTEILRDEWGFEGIVVSDWGAVNDRVKGLGAGLELEMPGVAVPSNDVYIVEAVKSGALDEKVLDCAVERILNVIKRVYKTKDGGINHPGTLCHPSEEGNDHPGTLCHPSEEGNTRNDKEKHDELARRIAAESIVLLKNDDKVLPLDFTANVVFIGEFAESPRYQGAGSSKVNPVKMTSALEATESEFAKVKYCKGYITDDCDDVNEALQNEAVAAAKGADACVLFVGLPPAYESEGYDRTHMRMPEGQNKLISAVAGVNENVVVVLHNGSPVEMPWLGNIKGLVEAYLGGQAGGGALADILFGAANPCGKLAESFPLKLSDNPSYLYYLGERDVTEYREGIFVGYRYYDTKEMNVAFPFGHGLSYTNFSYDGLRLSASSIKDSDTLTVTVNVKNTGDKEGKEIIQLYIGQKEKDDRLIRADKELKDFAKVSLKPGETKTVTFTLDKSAFAYYNTEINDWHVLSAEYEIMVGSSSANIRDSAVVAVESTVEIPFKADINTTVRDIRRMKNGDAFLQEMVEKSPMFSMYNNPPEPGTPEFMHFNAIPEMVPRQVRLMGAIPGLSKEDVQKLVEEKLNK